MKEQALALHDGATAARDNSAEGALYAGGGSATLVAFCTTRVGYKLA